MPTKAEIIQQIEEQIIPNLLELITGGILQNNLLGMVHQINDLVGELDDLETDVVTTIVAAINSLKLRIDGIEDDLTPYVYYGGDDPNVTMPIGFGGEIPSFYVQQMHVGIDVENIALWTYTGVPGSEWINLMVEGIQSIQAGTNVTIDNTDPLNPIISASGGGGDLTLEQARQNGNVLDGDVEIMGNGSDYKIFSNGDDDNKRITLNFGDGSFSLSIEDISNIEDISTLNSINLFSDFTVLSKGMLGNEEFDKQGDRKAFAQISDLDDSITAREQTIRMILTPEGEDASVKDVIGFFADGDYDIISVNATAKTAPTGSAIEIGLKVNGVDVTDVPVTIASGDKTSFGSTPAEFTATIGLGDEITPSILSVGSTIKGKDLQLIFKYKEII